MAGRKQVIWGLYPGEHDGAGGDFGNTSTLHSNHVIGIGWPATGSLAALVREQSPLTVFYERIKAAYQGAEDISQWTSEQQHKWFDRSSRILRRFLCEAQTGDLVVYACKTEECVYVARIKADTDGLYKYDAAESDKARIHWHYRHFRPVDWVNRISYQDCTEKELRQARLQSIFWQMKACPEKFLTGL